MSKPKSYTMRMSLAQWAKLPPHPKQRPTEAHARKVRSKNLSKMLDTHRYVAACLMPDGTLYKADGHTRDYLWQAGDLEPPVGKLEVRVHVCDDMDEANLIYDTYDNPDAAENGKDRLGGAFRFHGITAINPGVTDSMTTALQILCGSAVPVLEMVARWREEIILALQIHNGGLKLGGPMVAAMLASFRRHGTDVLPLWNNYRQNIGVEVNDERCPVKELIAKRNEPRFARSGSVQRREGAEYFLGTVERWIRSPVRRAKSKATGLVLTDYLAGENVNVPVSQMRGNSHYGAAKLAA